MLRGKSRNLWEKRVKSGLHSLGKWSKTTQKTDRINLFAQLAAEEMDVTPPVSASKNEHHECAWCSAQARTRCSDANLLDIHEAQTTTVQKLTDKSPQMLHIKRNMLDSSEQKKGRAESSDLLREPVRVALVGKYTCLSYSYLSVVKALLHASVDCQKKLVLDWIPTSNLESTTVKENSEAYKAAWKLLKGADGILVPGGFGDRRVLGKIIAVKYAGENRIPFLGICFGMQITVIEFARSVLGVQDANSNEFEPQTKSP
ncbi:hypothetical protein VNO78_02597 [Psophocarpus tetragonolobus]|uniref:CTP synthase (glutamine hydrolyzing) n=1 Tax=Psophocarpus tetragonolobus TaxID=3891 RepID=A0AAN9XUU2_PSOTE